MVCRLLSALCLTLALADGAPTDPPLRVAAECRVRGGLPNVIAKLEKGDGSTVNIAYLGGSITAARGWRTESFEWIQKQFPRTKLNPINAAIGGTGSDLGVFRLGQDVLRHEPDLLFVEFAVNDGGAPIERIHRCMEGIVRQAWRANPRTDICFVYTLSKPFLADLQAGNCSRAASAMEDIADHYAIPSIHMGIEVAAMEEAGTLLFNGPKPTSPPAAGAPMLFSTDGVHPLQRTGHQLYFEAIRRSFSTIRAEGIAAAKHPLAAPYRDDHWTDAKMVPITKSMLSDEWQRLGSDSPIYRSFAKRMPELYQSTAPGATIRFRMRGSYVGIYDLLGPDCGLVLASIDQRSAKLYPRIDAWSTYHRVGNLKLASDLEEGNVHSIKIELASTEPDKAGIMRARNLSDYKANPKKYKGANWYVGSIMIIGEIVD